MFVCANDSALSGWGGVNRSLIAIRCDTDAEIAAATAWLEKRSEMKWVRLNLNLPKIKQGDNLAVWNRDTHPHIFGA